MAHNLAALGQSIVLFLPKYHFPVEKLPFRLIGISVIDFPMLRALSFNLFLAGHITSNYFSLQPKVVYVRRGISLMPALFAKMKRALLIYEINDDPCPHPSNEQSGIWKRLNRWLSVKTDEIYLNWCDAAFVITDEIKDKIFRALPNLDRGKLHTLPSGANTILYRPMDMSQCRRQLELNLSSRHVGFMGTLLDHQGVGVLIDAAPLVLQSFPDCRFVIIGEGPMKRLWQQQVDEKSLQENFLFTGQIEYEATPLWINAMDVCTAPFLKKAGLRSPVKIFDYLACGKPVVAARIPGTTDIFDGTGTVKLIEPENSRFLAEAILEILANDKEAEEAGSKGRRLVENHYSRRVLAKNIQTVILKLTEKKKSSS